MHANALHALHEAVGVAHHSPGTRCFNASSHLVVVRALLSGGVASISENARMTMASCINHRNFATVNGGVIFAGGYSILAGGLGLGGYSKCVQTLKHTHTHTH